MDHDQFWALIDTARCGVRDPSDAEAVASRAAAILAGYPYQDIAAVQQMLWDFMADSYETKLWAAAYEINGGCSDDLFDYFRGWLILQGRTTFERVVSDPDSLADLLDVQTAAAEGVDIECEAAWSIARTAYETATGRQLPTDALTIRYRDLEPGWDFDDQAEMRRRLPRLAALYTS